MKKIFLLLCAFSASLYAEIIELNHFKDIRSHLTGDTVVILDIDDTLLIPVQMLGCDEWFTARLQNSTLEKALAEWEAIRHITEMEIVEQGTAEEVRALQGDGYTVLGLTTQGIALATRTSQQLKTCGINLRQNAPGEGDLFLSIMKHGVLYRNGILFTSGQHKGEAFFALCDAINLTPKRIVFVNDKASHLENIEETAIERNIPFVGLRYAYSDARKAAYDPEIAELQFKNSSFDRILSDREAQYLLNTKEFAASK